MSTYRYAYIYIYIWENEMGVEIAPLKTLCSKACQLGRPQQSYITQLFIVPRGQGGEEEKRTRGGEAIRLCCAELCCAVLCDAAMGRFRGIRRKR